MVDVKWPASCRDALRIFSFFGTIPRFMSDPQTQGMAASNTGGVGTLFGSFPVIPDPGELYDSIMEQIEPELTRAMLGTLIEKYRHESPEEAAMRTERYAKAFDRCGKAMTKHIDTVNASLHAYGRTATESLEKLSQEDEQGAMATMEEMFDDTSKKAS